MRFLRSVRHCFAGILALQILVALTASSSLGCSTCASEGEYCVEEDCCEGLTCQFVEAQGYRCK